MESWWSGMPCDERISRECGLKMSDVTWDGVARELRRAPVVVFQKWIVRSDEPPPEARRLEFQGHHARAWKNRDEKGPGLKKDATHLDRCGVVRL